MSPAWAPIGFRPAAVQRLGRGQRRVFAFRQGFSLRDAVVFQHRLLMFGPDETQPFLNEQSRGLAPDPGPVYPKGSLGGETKPATPSMFDRVAEGITRVFGLVAKEKTLASLRSLPGPLVLRTYQELVQDPFSARNQVRRGGHLVTQLPFGRLLRILVPRGPSSSPVPFLLTRNR